MIGYKAQELGLCMSCDFAVVPRTSVGVCVCVCWTGKIVAGICRYLL
jgi:hypothetical protein